MSSARYLVPQPGLISLQNVSGGTSSGAGLLTKTAASGWNNCGAGSVRSIASGDCAVYLPAGGADSLFVIGLDRSASCVGYGGVDFALVFSGANALIYENGGLVLNCGAMNPATQEARVSIEGGFVRYRKAGAMLYESLIAPSYPLYAVCALYTQGSSLAGLTIFEAAESLLGVPSGSVVKV